MKKKVTYLPTEPVESLITFVRGQKVILDTDLARIYGVETRALNQAMKRNSERFPADFVFQLSEFEAREVAASRSQNVTLNAEALSRDSQTVDVASDTPNSSQIVMSSRKHRGISYLPYAYTEHGAFMAATVLNSPQAVQMSVFVVRAFVKMREVLTNNQTLADKLTELERKLTSRLDVHERSIVVILRELRQLMNPPARPEPPRKQIGFRIRERRARYGVIA